MSARVPTLAERRLAAQHVAKPALASPRAVVEHLGALQAQDYAAATWAIGLRARRARLAAVERAIERGEILRTWPMRGTIHFVLPKDALWMLRALASRQTRASDRRLRELGVTARDLATARRALARALAAGGIPRADAYAALDRAGVATRGQRGIQVINRLAFEGLLCIGPREGKQATIALLDDWARPRPDARGDRALAGLATRYFASRGPATVADFAWWTGLGKREAATAAEAAKGLRRDGDLWESARPRAARARLPDAHILPAFDEAAVAYKDRSAALARVGPGVANAQIGLLSPCIVIDGQMVGTWGRTIGKDRVRIALKPLVAWSREEREAVESAAEAYARFLGLAADVEVRATSRKLATRPTTRA